MILLTTQKEEILAKNFMFESFASRHL